MKIKLTKKQSIIIIVISTLLLIIGLFCWLKKPNKPIQNKPISYNNTQTYEQALQTWKDQCYFKPGKYTCEQIREKLGRNNRKVYCLDSGEIKFSDSLRSQSICANVYDNYELDYKYVTGVITDDWYFTHPNQEVSYFLTMNKLSLTGKIFILGTSSNSDGFYIQFNTYVDTTPPPNPPQTN